MIKPVKDIPICIRSSRGKGKTVFLLSLFEEEKEKIYILKKERNTQMINVNSNFNVSPLGIFERKAKSKEFSYSFSPKTEEMFAIFRKDYANSLPIEKREAKEMEKKVGKERGKRGKGKGCE